MIMTYWISWKEPIALPGMEWTFLTCFVNNATLMFYSKLSDLVICSSVCSAKRIRIFIFLGDD